LQFALFDGIVEFDECPLLSEGEQTMGSEDASLPPAPNLLF
jgi:hypothetical protein